MERHWKKVVVGLWIIVLLLLVPGVAYAADTLYRMLHADEVESFKQDQDAMIVGQLIEKQGDKFKVKVLKLLSGKVNSDIILVSADFTYGWEKETPNINDFGVFSLKKTGDYYKKAWGIFKANSGDYQTLKLESLNAPIPWLLGDLACIQWYVNSGGKENDFHGHNTTMFVRRPNGQDVQIYPDPTTEEEATREAAAAYKNSLTQIQNAPTRNMKTGVYSFNFVRLIMAVSILGVGVTIFVIRQRRKAG